MIAVPALPVLQPYEALDPPSRSKKLCYTIKPWQHTHSMMLPPYHEACELAGYRDPSRTRLGVKGPKEMFRREPWDHAAMAATPTGWETVADSTDMLSRVERSLVIGLSASIPAPPVALGKSGQGSFVFRGHHEARPLMYLRELPPGCTTYRPE